MKVFISVDMEGIAGITHFDETIKGRDNYEYFAHLMSKEVKAACIGAIEAGASEIVVKDAHETGRNIDFSCLPKEVKLIRDWSGDPLSMVQGLDSSFDACIFIGYHSPSSSGGNPMSHTMHVSNVSKVKLNDKVASEFTLHSLAAQMLGVPSVFISGDKALIEDVKKTNPNIKFLAVNEGIGSSTISIHPKLAREKIEKNVKEALSEDLKKYKIEIPKEFVMEIEYSRHNFAYRASFYPGCEKINDTTIRFKTNDYFEILRAGLFLF